MPDRNKLELSVTNFGPIAEAEIDLRPLTVFVAQATRANLTWQYWSMRCTGLLEASILLTAAD